MPIYEYKCKSCENLFEIQHGINEVAKRKCPECGGNMQRLISQNAFLLKGGGWYKDGYSAGNSGNEKKPAKKADAKPDAKPDAKKETAKAAVADKPKPAPAS